MYNSFDTIDDEIKREGPPVSDYESEYYESNEQSDDRPALKFYYRVFKRELGNQGKRSTVLEYGCGVGHLTKRLCQDFDIHAVDISDYALARVKKIAPKAMTANSIKKIKDGSVDGIIALHVLEHIKDPSVTLEQFNKKLKKGGLLVYVVPNPGGYGYKLKRDKWFGYSDNTHVSMFGQDKWIRLTKKGFIIKKVRGDGMWDVPYLPVVPVILQKLIFFPPAAIQYWLGRLFLPTKLGECLIVVARKK